MLKLPATYSDSEHEVPSKQTSTSTVWRVSPIAASIRLVMVNVTGLVTDTPVVLFAGVVEEQLERIGSIKNWWPSVNVLVLKGATELPSMSAKPPTKSYTPSRPSARSRYWERM